MLVIELRLPGKSGGWAYPAAGVTLQRGWCRSLWKVDGLAWLVPLLVWSKVSGGGTWAHYRSTGLAIGKEPEQEPACISVSLTSSNIWGLIELLLLPPHLIQLPLWDSQSYKRILESSSQHRQVDDRTIEHIYNDVIQSIVFFCLYFY